MSVYCGNSEFKLRAGLYMLYWEEKGKSSAQTELSHQIVDTVKEMYKKSLQILVVALPGTLPGQ